MSRLSIIVCLLTALAACGEVSSDPPVDATPPIDAPTIDTPVVPDTYPLTVRGDGTGTGTIVSNPAGINCGADCSQDFADGTTVTLTATAALGSTFTGWTGPCVGTGTCMVTITAATMVIANFAIDQTLTVTVIGNGAVASVPTGIDCGSDCTETYPASTVVTLTASPGLGAGFAGWSGGSCTGTGTCAVRMDAMMAVTATFTTNQAALTVIPAGNGQGVITSAPAGITCGADCAESYDLGTVITLTATPAVGSSFAGWSGGGCTGVSTCAVTLTAATAVSATFSNNPTLAVTRAGNGTGTVTSTPAGINCGTDCTESYPVGTSVVLTSTAALGSTFAGWSGGSCSGLGTCALGLSGSTTVTATFTLNIVTLTVVKSGNGTGTVVSTPAGINCGSDCSEPYGFGATVTLTATPAIGSTFTGWSGGSCAGTGTCTVTIAVAVTVTASFTRQQVTLTVARAGAGTGTVTSSPAGINCGTDCSELVAYGDTVMLTATPAVASRFIGWSGASCAGTGTCSVTVTAATTVTATFVPGACDGFASADTTTVRGWTERVGDWAIFGGRLRDSTTGSVYTHVITMDDSSQRDGCGRLTAFHNGTPGTAVAGIVLRWTPPASYVVALVQDNSGAGDFNSMWIYQYPGSTSIGNALPMLPLGRSPNIEACVVGTTVTLRADAARDGTYETMTTGTTTLTGTGLTGVMTLSNGSNPTVDDFCWGP